MSRDRDDAVYRIAKRFEFSAGHQLPSLPEGHKCRRPHGHNYIVEVELTASRLDEFGFVVDFAALEPLGEFLNDHLDHRDLNTVLDVMPTSEQLARYIFEWCTANLPLPTPDLIATVRVSETSSTWAEYTGRPAGHSREA